MATLALAVVGGALGGWIGGATVLGATLGAAIGRGVGAVAGALIDSALLAPKARNVEGPRLSDLKVGTSAYGAPIARHFGGTVRLAGHVIWASDLRETARTQRVRGGKGGGRRSSSATTYTYSCDLAVAFCTGPVQAVPKIFGDGKLLVDNGTCHRAAGVTIYLGTETQTANALIQAAVGAANCPAYRGICYVVFEDLQLADFGNRIPMLSAIVQRPVQTAAGAIAEIAELVGLSGQVDGASLAGELRGYAVARETTARAAIDEVLFAANGIATQVPGGLAVKARPVGALAGTDLDFLGTGENEPAKGDRYELERAQDIDVPREMTLTFPDPARDYQEGAVRSFRDTGGGRNRGNVATPVVLTPDEAKARLEQVHYDAAAAQVATYRFALPPSAIALQPGERIDVVLGGRRERLLLQQVTVGANGIVECTALREVAAVWTAHGATGTSGLLPPNTAPQIVPTVLHLLDLPMLDPADDDAGFYVAMGGAAGWTYAELFRAPDGVNFQPILQQNLAAIVGSATTVLGSGPTAFIDEGNTVDVTLVNTTQTLASVTDAELFLGQNGCVLGEEILQFRTATLLGPGQYRLSGLVRGRQGTEEAIATHATGERFVFLGDLSAIARIRDPLSLRNAARDYRAVSAYQTLAAATTQSFTNTARALRPWSVVHVTGERNAAQDLTISWIRRSRIPHTWADHADAPLGEASESYEIDIRNAANTATLRTLTASAPTVTYTAADQTTDFGAPQSSIRVRIFQISATVGRGAMTEVIL